MNKQKWLERGRDLDREIRALQEAKERAYSDAVRITSFVDVSKGAGGRRNTSRGGHADALTRVYEFEELRALLQTAPTQALQALMST